MGSTIWGSWRYLQILATGRDELDITQVDAVNGYFQEHKPEIVINAAAYTAVDKAESEPELAYAINRDGAANLARACAEANIPLLHISTDYVFDGRKEEAYVETDESNSQTVYGKSKLAGENAIESILKQYIILRVSWVFGANGNNFVKTMLRLSKERDVLKIVSDQYGGPTPATDIAKTLLNIVKYRSENGAIPCGIYHYSGEPVTSWYEFAEAIFEKAAALQMVDRIPSVGPITTSEYPTPAKRPFNSVLDCQKIKRELNITQPEWHTGLDNVLMNWKV